VSRKRPTATRMAASYLISLLDNKNAAESVPRLQDLLERKLWHQLTLAIEEEMSKPWLQEGDTFVMFYECFIQEFEQKINPLKMTQFAIAASSKYSDDEAAQQFLVSTMGRMKPSKQEKPSAEVEAKCIFNCEIARHKLELGKMEEAKELMKGCEKQLDSIAEATDLTNSYYYRLNAEYHKKRKSPAEFYRASLQYLTYTPMSTLSVEEQRDTARDLCLAALVADSIFTFGELLSHPVLSSLEGTEHAWMTTMLTALNIGNITQYNALCEAEKVRISQYDIMLANETLLRQKLSIAALIELIFQRKADERLIPFADIASGTNLPVDQVELLLIKALSLKLIRGTIDEVEQCVHITWAVPHALDMDQIRVLKDNLGSWQIRTQEMMNYVEDQSPELFT